jgi:hypothetical protein
MNYPVLSMKKLTCDGRFPADAEGHVPTPCPICQADEAPSWMSLKWRPGKDFGFDKFPTDVENLLYQEPHIAFKCGGVYREDPANPGFWSGKCGAKKVQTEINFTFDEETEESYG